MALTVTGESVSRTLLKAPKVIVWARFATVKVRVTSGATPKFEVPACVAVSEQLPAARMVTVLPDTVQISVVLDVSVTVNNEEAEGPSVTGETPKVTLAGCANVMVCEAALTRKVRTTSLAAS